MSWTFTSDWWQWVGMWALTAWGTYDLIWRVVRWARDTTGVPEDRADLTRLRRIEHR